MDGLNGCTYDVMPDRIEAGSYACAAGITGGSIELVGARAGDVAATATDMAGNRAQIDVTEVAG